MSDPVEAWNFDGAWWVKGREIKRLEAANVGGMVTLCEGHEPIRWNPGARPDLRTDCRHWVMRKLPKPKSEARP